MNECALSIITICRSNPDELERTLASFDGLDRTLIEVVVVDGSADEECSAVVRASAGSVTRYVHSIECGLYQAMNIGIENASGVALLFINSGDVLYDPRHLNLLISQHSEMLAHKILYGAYIQEIRGHHILKTAPHLDGKSNLRNLPCHQAIMLPTQFCRMNKYDSNLQFLADAVLMNHALSQLAHVRLDEPIAIVPHGGISSMPRGWGSVFTHYGETLAIFDLSAREKLTSLLQLCGRKIVAQLFGREILEKIQLWRALRHISPGGKAMINESQSDKA